MTLADVSGVVAVVSVVVNIIQWMHRRQEKKSLSSNAIDTYCYFHQVATFCGDAKMRYEQETEPSPLAQYMLRLIDSINTLAGAARLTVKSYSQVHLGFTPKFQDPGDEGRYQVDEYPWLIKHGLFRDSFRDLRQKSVLVAQGFLYDPEVYPTA